MEESSTLDKFSALVALKETYPRTIRDPSLENQ